MKKLILGLIAIAVVITGIFTFAGCEKEETNNGTHKCPEEIEQANQDISMSLDEFISSVHTEEERIFFERNVPLDYANECLETLTNNSIENNFEESRFKIIFKWGGDGCSTPLGICFILSHVIPSEENATILFCNDNCIILPETEENGLTSDLYLPIFNDVRINDSTLIRHGIYKAYCNEATGSRAILVDLINSPDEN